MALEHLRRELLVLAGQEAARQEACWREVADAREAFLATQVVLEELQPIAIARELARPEGLSREGVGSGSYSIFGFRDGLGDGRNVSDQSEPSTSDTEGLAAEVHNALLARSKRWQSRTIPQPSPSRTGLAVETDALQAALQATSTYLSLYERMRTAIEVNVLQQQDDIDKTEFLAATSRAKAAILKLQSLEYHMMVGTYRPEDVAALSKVRQELAERAAQLRTQLGEAQKSLSIYRGLGPTFHEQLSQFRELQQRLMDAQYMLDNFNRINTELEAAADDLGGTGLF